MRIYLICLVIFFLNSLTVNIMSKFAVPEIMSSSTMLAIIKGERRKLTIEDL